MLKPYPQFRGLLDGDWAAPSSGFWERVKGALWAAIDEEPLAWQEDDEYEDEEDESLECAAHMRTRC